MRGLDRARMATVKSVDVADAGRESTLHQLVDRVVQSRSQSVRLIVVETLDEALEQRVGLVRGSDTRDELLGPTVVLAGRDQRLLERRDRVRRRHVVGFLGAQTR